MYCVGFVHEVCVYLAVLACQEIVLVYGAIQLLLLLRPFSVLAMRRLSELLLPFMWRQNESNKEIITIIKRQG